MAHVFTQTPTFKLNELLNGITLFNKTQNRTKYAHAFEKVCSQLEETYPQWTEALFDRSFLTKEAAPLFEQGNIPTPIQLATAWRNQFGIGNHRERDIDAILPIVADFLDLYYLEIHYG
ncbi:MAG: hypothetical protein AAF490_22050 [Chloroflexota bacterium]